MRTPTTVGLTILATAAVITPASVAAHDYLGLDFGIQNTRAGTQQALPGTGDGSGNGAANGSSGSSATPLPGGSGTTGNSASTTGQAATAAQTKGVVMIETALNGGEGAGTGMVLRSDGVVLTNYHVVADSTQIRVTVPGGRSYTATVLGHDQSHDIAVLKLKDASGLDTVRLDTDGVKTAEQVLAVGQGNGQGVLYAAKGTITATGQQITATDSSSLATSEKLTGLLETNAPIVPGYSGGPLFDADGEVIGIDTAASSSNSLAQYNSGSNSAAQGFAIPITQAKSIADSILAKKTTATNHIGARAALGVEVSPSSSDPRLGSQTGVVVRDAVNGTGAATAGITAGSTITSINGAAITDSTDLSHVMDRTNPGQKVSVTWTDAYGTTHTASVTLGTSTTN